LGNIVGTLIETFFPFLALLVLRKNPRITLIPPIEKLQRIDLYDIIGILTFGAMFYTVYSTSLYLYLDLRNNLQHHALSEFITQWIAAIGTICGTPLLLRNQKKKFELQLEIQRQQAEYERQRREAQERYYENEIQMNQKKIVLYEQEIEELKELSKHLKRLKVEPQKILEVLNNAAGAIDQLTNTVNELKERDKAMKNSDFVTLSVNKLNLLIGCELTENEKLVLQWIVNDKTFQEIADIIHLAEGTVKNTASNLYKKFKVKNKDELIKFLLRYILNEQN
jgi:DNA-binding CsgD family transcriptional regulator